ncbi:MULTISPECIES: hypothetical protein [Brevibacillus]|jgi:hypothetical protein|uniref:DUF2897 domain-containing protein n=2 Tax=Brevibacillus TaxID=55080 RepID=A0AA48M8P7_9BACL|nr:MULTISPECIES: hypothetical protein [Bacillales]MDT3415926.1 hypothetical protein [Brevibacillus aydinogluensis]UFJ61484.1 hypothetical protein IRT44_01080 [Anoxybacillus sediminis]CAJ1001650.1 DUF2897 domain-containing protein [Brevibacillus aydinogluensis]
MSTLYLIIGIVLGLAGFGMLFYAMSNSPLKQKRDQALRKKSAEQHRGAKEVQGE